MWKLKRTEAVFLAVAGAFFALAVGVRLGGSASGDGVAVTAATAPAVRCTEAPAVPSDGAKIDINSADAGKLTLLPGIGDVLAERIIRYREENGAFAEISDIMNVKGIGEGTFGKIKDYIATGEAP